MEFPRIGKIKYPTPWIIGLMVVGVLAIGSTMYIIMGEKKPKFDINKLTILVKSQTLTVRITSSGTVLPVQSVNLSPKSSGRLQKLFVEQGDRVQEGQIIAIMENKELQAQARQAKANWDGAKARLALGEKGTRQEEIDQAQARLQQAQARLAQAQTGGSEEIAQAKAKLRQAEARLAQGQSGRWEEIDQAQAQVDDAQGKVNRTRERLHRYQSLIQEGAITQDQFTDVKTENITAEANLKQLQKRLEQVKKGSRPEEIAQFQGAVSEAKYNLQQVERGSRPEEIKQLQAAVSEARIALKQLQNGKRPEEIQDLKAAVSQAQAQFLAIQVQLDDTNIRAPFAGIITQKYANEGAFVTPTTSASSTNSATSTSVVALAKDLEIKAKVPEVDVGQIKPGQQVEIIADAYSEQVFKGRVRLIAPEAVVDQNVTSFEIRVSLDTGKAQLRSGMNVNVTFLGEEVKNALVVPTVAIVTQDGKTGVLVPDADHKPEFRAVKIGTSIENQTQILEGLQAGDRLFIDVPKDSQPQKKSDDSRNKAAQNRVIRTGTRSAGINPR